MYFPYCVLFVYTYHLYNFHVVSYKYVEYLVQYNYLSVFLYYLLLTLQLKCGHITINNLIFDIFAKHDIFLTPSKTMSQWYRYLTSHVEPQTH